jgi:hypothetical protein
MTTITLPHFGSGLWVRSQCESFCLLDLDIVHDVLYTVHTSRNGGCLVSCRRAIDHARQVNGASRRLNADSRKRAGLVNRKLRFHGSRDVGVVNVLAYCFSCYRLAAAQDDGKQENRERAKNPLPHDTPPDDFLASARL